MKLLVTDHEGNQHTIDAPAGESVMQAIREANIDIAAQCGGCCSCATCHVYVDDNWKDRLLPPSEEELAMLELAMEPMPVSRLSCQITAHPDLDGLTLTLAPGSTL